MFDRIMRWDEETGSVEESRSGAGYANGHTVDRAGRLVSCEQGNRRVTRTDHDGSVVVLADRFDADYDGHRGESEIGARHVFRLDPRSGEATAIGRDFLQPNGLGISADERQVYVVDTALKHVRVFDVGADAVLTGGRVFATCDAGSFDGLRLRSQAEPPLRDVLELGLRPEGQRQWRPLAAGPPATARWLLRQHTGWTAAGQRG